MVSTASMCFTVLRSAGPEGEGRNKPALPVAETAGLFLAQRKKISPKACAFEDTAMELLSRFELETSSLPRMRSTN